MKIAIGTKNAAKINAVENICNSLLDNVEYVTHDVPSLVAIQPIGDMETLQGAKNRAAQACKEDNSDMAFGLEGGVKELDGQLYLCNWGVLKTRLGQQYIAGGAQIPLPDDIANSLRNGGELGPLMDAYTNQKGIRHHEGAIGVFTNGIVKRGEMFEHIVILLVGQYLRAHTNS